jgi:membrane-bound serine protease (ClpP class)
MFYPVLLFILAQVFLFLEFFIPGGVLAILAILTVFIGTFLVAFSEYGWLWAFVYLSLSILLAIPIGYLALRKVKGSSKKDTFFLSNDQSGYSASDLKSDLIGKVGVATTDMKPSGHIEIENLNYQAISDRGYITSGQSVEIIALRGSYYIVIPYTKS